MPHPRSFSPQWPLLLALLLLRIFALAQAPAAYLARIPDPKRLGETYVSNPDKVLSAGTVADLNQTLRALDQSGRAHIDVVAARSIGEVLPKTAATALFNHWKIGAKGKDNGLLILLVMDQRRIEFETGYGLEADLPDVVCYRIQQQYMVPALKAGQTDEAVRQGVAAVLRQLSAAGGTAGADSAAAYWPDGTPVKVADVDVQALAAAEAAKPSVWPTIGGVVAWMLVMVLYTLLWYATTRKSPNRYLAGTVLLVPIGLGIGLLMSERAALNALLLLGVGYVAPLLYMLGYLRRVRGHLRGDWAALGRLEQYQNLRAAHRGLGFTAWIFALPLAWYWPRYQRQLRELREAPYPCPNCGHPMHRLSEAEEDPYLDKGQQAEELVASVDYDVWRCDACKHTLKLDYQNPDTDAEPCPECHYRTYFDGGRTVVQAATRHTSGWGWQRMRCRNCGYETQERYTIDRLPEPASSSGSSSGSSYSSSSSGGSSSGSSSGGSSGGGGAGSSW